VVETPVYDLTVFKIHFGKLTLKAYTKGEHVLRFEAIVHNTAELRAGRAIERFADVVAALAGMLERFVTTCDCVHAGFVSDATLDQLAERARLGASVVAGSTRKPRQRAVLKAVLALAAAPAGFSVGELARKVQAITANPDYTVRQASYDLLRPAQGARTQSRHQSRQLGRCRPIHTGVPVGVFVVSLVVVIGHETPASAI
jgi:hypothetical protein